MLNKERLSDFDQLIDMLVPKRGYAVMLHAYLDASKREETFCVAGLAFGPDRAKKANREWYRLWGDTICHMTDLNSRAKGTAFEHWSREKASDYLIRSVKIINKFASYGVAVSCNLQEVRDLSPKKASPEMGEYIGGFRYAYGICSHLAMASLGKAAAEKDDAARIAYIFESGDRHQGEFRRFVGGAVKAPENKKMYLHRSDAYIDKGDCRLLEPADILAWEWGGQRKRLENGQPMRPSLKALLNYENGDHSDIDFASANRRCLHVTGAPLKRYFEKVKALVLS